MSRLIDADALLLALDKRKTYELADGRNRAYGKGVRDAMKDIGKQPTVDAAPVVHGHLVQEGEPPMFSLTCSVCGQKFFNHYLQPHANYCSMCGAKMDESTCSNNSNTLDALERR